MKRPTKQEIKEAVEKLKNPPQDQPANSEQSFNKIAPKKSSMRIRKQGI